MADDSFRDAAKTARAVLLYTVGLVLLKLAQSRASRSYVRFDPLSSKNGSARSSRNFFVGFYQPSSGGQQTCFFYQVLMITLEMKEKFVCKALLRALRSTPPPQFRAIKRVRRRK